MSLPQSPKKAASTWSERYGQRHRLEWITEFPAGIQGPEKVRIYRRRHHFLLQWWDRASKRTLSERVNGDLVAAIMRSRQIDERLGNFLPSGGGRRRIIHSDLVEQFRDHLIRRAEAQEIDPKTVVRYGSALEHYAGFTAQSTIEVRYPSASQVDQEFALQLSAYLTNLQISPNGHPNSSQRPMVSTRYVEDVCRTMFTWAAHPQRGNLLPEGFRNPFAGKGHRTTDAVRDLFGEPDITLEMAGKFLGACDPYQLPIFALLVFYGLRASEPCFLFHENMAEGWLKIPCIPTLAYTTKGRRDKRAPLIEPIQTLLLGNGSRQGPLFLRRGVLAGTERPKLLGASLAMLEAEFKVRSERMPGGMVDDRHKRRDLLLRDAGAIGYDHIEHEFRKIARQLGWPANATVKDFRHLFASTLQNAGVPEFYRKYLMGQSPGKAAIVNYTHLNELRTHYEEAVRRRFQPLVEIVKGRMAELAAA